MSYLELMSNYMLFKAIKLYLHLHVKCPIFLPDSNQTSIFLTDFNPYPTAFPYGNGMVLHFYQQQESSTTKTVHKVINKGLKTYVGGALHHKL